MASRREFLTVPTSVVVGEVGPLEGAVAALGLVEDRDVRLDPTLMHQPREHLG